MPSWDDVVSSGSGLPGVEVSTSYGTPRPTTTAIPTCSCGWLEEVDPVELAELVEDIWRTRAPKRLVAEHDRS